MNVTYRMGRETHKVALEHYQQQPATYGIRVFITDRI